MPKIEHKLEVAGNEKMCPRYYRLAFFPGTLASKVRPGQFIHIRLTDGHEPFFRRPFSVFRAQDRLEIFYEPVGKGTRILARKRRGETLDVLGPLGNHFALPPAGVEHVVMIAGGIGVAPFMILSDALKKKKCSLTLLYGARSKDHVFSFRPFQKNGCRVLVATDDGSVGRRGKVSVLWDQIQSPPEKTFLYTCGPRPMMRAVQAFARQQGLRGQASCEEVMACGLGACLGCAIKTRGGYKTVCDDGPVFDLQDLVF